jgi:hypothetical protein
MKGADLRYTDLTKSDLTDANPEGVDIYPCNVSKRTKLWGALIDAGSELEMMRREIAEVNRWKDFGEQPMMEGIPNWDRFAMDQSRSLDSFLSERVLVLKGDITNQTVDVIVTRQIARFSVEVA